MWRIGWAPNSVPIYIQQDATLHSLFISGNRSKYFRVILPLIIRSAYSIWYLSHRYCYLPLSWKSWNRFECAVGGVGWTPNSIPIYIQQDATLHSLFVSGNCSTCFRAVLPPIIRSAYNCIYIIWYFSHRYCCLSLSWKSWNRFECAVGGVRRTTMHSQPVIRISSLCCEQALF
jgi:hypothetical protein